MDFYHDIHFLHGACGRISSGIINLIHRDYYCLQYNHAGRIRIQTGRDEEVIVTGPSLLFTFPGTAFHFGSGDEGTWHHNYVAFNGLRVERYIKAGLLSRKTPVRRILNGERFLGTFLTCVEAVTRGASGNAAAAHALEGLLLQMHEEDQGQNPEGRMERVLRHLAAEVGAQPEKAWDFHREAKALHLSYGHLRRLFRTVTGEAPGQYLLQARLARAAELLIQSTAEIKEVAAAVGISDIHYFTKLFRRRYQLPPSRFRREIRGT